MCPQTYPNPIVLVGLAPRFLRAPSKDAQPLYSEAFPVDKAIVQKADLICAFKNVLECLKIRFPCLFKEKETLPLALPLKDLAQTLSSLQDQGRNILLCTDGDPLYFGLASTLTRLLNPARLTIIPSPSCLQRIAASLKMPWETVRSVSLHGRKAPKGFSLFYELDWALLAREPICVLCDDRTTPKEIALHLLDLGFFAEVLHVFAHLDSEAPFYWKGTSTQAQNTTFPSASTLLIERVHHRAPFLGLARAQLSDKAPYMSNRAVRAAVLSYLTLSSADIFWDIGAGSGAVSLEASRLLPQGWVFAFEEDAKRAQALTENKRALHAANITLVQGRAQEHLSTSLDPNAIFIGGGLSGAEGLELLEEATIRLKSGGNLVLTATLLETLEKSRAFFTARNWPLIVAHLLFSESVALGQGTHLRSHNPVFLLHAQKP